MSLFGCAARESQMSAGQQAVAAAQGFYYCIVATAAVYVVVCVANGIHDVHAMNRNTYIICIAMWLWQLPRDSAMTCHTHRELLLYFPFAGSFSLLTALAGVKLSLSHANNFKCNIPK